MAELKIISMDEVPVSYTHLPYEIKEIITVVKAYSSAVGAGEFVSEIFGDEADEPVSYTHLDVYKRQAFGTDS